MSVKSEIGKGCLWRRYLKRCSVLRIFIDYSCTLKNTMKCLIKQWTTFFQKPCTCLLLFLVYFIHLSDFSHGTAFIGLEVKLQWEVLFALCRRFYKFQGRKAVYFSHICFVLILCDTVCWMLLFLASSEMGNLHCCKMLKPSLILQNCCNVFVSNNVFLQKLF